MTEGNLALFLKSLTKEVDIVLVLFNAEKDIDANGVKELNTKDVWVHLRRGSQMPLGYDSVRQRCYALVCDGLVLSSKGNGNTNCLRLNPKVVEALRALEAVE